MFNLSPIGTIHTPFKDRADAPRQPGTEGRSAEGLITLDAGHDFEQALEDLDGFEFIWIIAWFHRNRNWKTKVRPPRGSAKKRGVFATRSPHRPNPIGLSLARLVEVKGRTIRVAETDLLDGTPILDIKPYLPFAEAFPGARAGWLEQSVAQGELRHAVEWSPRAREQCEWLRDRFGVELQRPAERVLARNAEPHPYRRIALGADGVLTLAVKSWRVRFSCGNARVSIERIASGYAPEALRRRERPLHDEAAHLAFHQRWPV